VQPYNTPSSAFDSLAPTYDADFTASPIAQRLRARVHARLLHAFHPGDHVLELGCGTGQDALALAAHGVSITATDASDGMLATARANTAHQRTITLQKLDLNALPDDALAASRFWGAFANFGVVNCVHDRPALARWLASRIPVGGAVAFGVMGRYCLWEIGWHVLRAKFDIAFRRLRGFSTFAVGDSPPVAVYYPTVGAITADFAPFFRRAHVQPLGVLLPPTALYPIVERRPALLRRLRAWDDRLIAPSLANYADHYWIEFERIP
jgi:SAM-dependent methyltransferase